MYCTREISLSGLVLVAVTVTAPEAFAVSLPLVEIVAMSVSDTSHFTVFADVEDAVQVAVNCTDAPTVSGAAEAGRIDISTEGSPFLTVKGTVALALVMSRLTKVS